MPQGCSRLHQSVHRQAIGRIEHGHARLGRHHGQIFESHLRRTILADADTDVVPTSFMFDWLIAAIRMKSYARENAAKVATNGILPQAAMPPRRRAYFARQ